MDDPERDPYPSVDDPDEDECCPYCDAREDEPHSATCILMDGPEDA